MTYTIYDPITGEISGTVVGDPDQLEQNLNGKSYIEGSWSGRDYYIENNQPVKISDNPSTPYEPYVWDCVSRAWIFNLEKSIGLYRAERNSRLSQIDRVNSIWYASLSADQQRELADYRQALLAVPQQSGFPETVNWPAKPAWL
jgi:hypothetical protein